MKISSWVTVGKWMVLAPDGKFIGFFEKHDIALQWAKKHVQRPWYVIICNEALAIEPDAIAVVRDQAQLAVEIVGKT